eukprot:8776106-Pyramimonas_sp.AAC.1
MITSSDLGALIRRTLPNAMGKILNGPRAATITQAIDLIPSLMEALTSPLAPRDHAIVQCP